MVRDSGVLGVAHSGNGKPAAAVQNAVGASRSGQFGDDLDGVQVMWHSREPSEVDTSGLVWRASLGEQSATGANQLVDVLFSPLWGAWFDCGVCLACAELHSGLPPGSRETLPTNR